MIDIETIARQVKRNCNISDAQYWGSYSLCGLLLRLRELYRTEMGIRQWENVQQRNIGDWITERETLWKELEDKDFEKISINGKLYDPFKVGQINAELEREGLIYGAGLGIHMKPSFFLADMVSKDKTDGFIVYTAGTEYARDLSDHPAMLQDKIIFARLEPTKQLIWGKFDEMRCRNLKGTLAFSFSKYGITKEEEPSEDIDMRISLIARSELETYIYHELGEAFEGGKIGDDWKNLLTHIQHTKAEIFARSVKDILSDTTEHGMLNFIISNKKEGSLGFYIVFLGGARKIIFPEILDAFQLFVDSGDWEFIDNARKTGYRKAEAYTDRLLAAYRNREADVSLSESIEKKIFGGLL